MGFTEYLQSFRGRTWFLLISCPPSQVHGNARWMQPLGPCLLSSVWRIGWMPFVAWTFLQFGLHFKPWGLLLHPWEDSTLESSWELCPGILTKLTYLIFSAWKFFCFIWCFPFLHLSMVVAYQHIRGQDFVLWIIPALESNFILPFPSHFLSTPRSLTGFTLVMVLNINLSSMFL